MHNPEERPTRFRPESAVESNSPNTTTRKMAQNALSDHAKREAESKQKIETQKELTDEQREAELRQEIKAQKELLASLMAELEGYPSVQPERPERPPVKSQTTPETRATITRGKHEIIRPQEKDDIDDFAEDIQSATNAAIEAEAVTRANTANKSATTKANTVAAATTAAAASSTTSFDYAAALKVKRDRMRAVAADAAKSAYQPKDLPSLDHKISTSGTARSISANPNSSRPKSKKLEQEPTTPADIKKTYNKAKHNSIFRTKAQKITAISLAVTSVASLVAAGGLWAKNYFNKDNNAEMNPTQPYAEAVTQNLEDESLVAGPEDIYLSNGDTATWAPEAIQPIFTENYQNQPPFIGVQPSQAQRPSRFQGMSQQEIFDMMAKSPELRQGLIDGYNKFGMFLSETKPSDISFASAKDLSKLFNNDEVDMMQYAAANQVETFADYLACMPDAIKPKSIRGLTLEQTVEMLETTDDETYRQLQTWFNNVMDMAYTRRKVIDGRYHNAYMMRKNNLGPMTHENMQLVSCVSDEYGTEVTEFFWTDNEGHEVGSMLVKMTPIRNTDGDIIGYDGCMQAVTPAGGHLYDGLPTINPPTPEYPPYIPPDNPPDNPPYIPPDVQPITVPVIKPKNPENLIRIDEQAHEDIAEDIGTGEVVVHQETAAQEDLTSQPTRSDYEGTEPEIVQSETSTEAESVTPQNPENDYSTDKGDAHASEYSPVQADEQAQAQADTGEISIEQAPTSGVDLESILAEFGNASPVDRIISEVRNNPTEYVAPAEGFNIEDILAEYGIQ